MTVFRPPPPQGNLRTVQHPRSYNLLSVLGDDRSTLELKASAGLYTHLNGPHSRVLMGQFKIGRIAAERAPHLTNQLVDDPRVSDPEWVKREGMVSFAGHPLMIDDRVVGVMAMFARKPLADVTLAALGRVARQVALGIENKRNEQALRANERRTRFALDAAKVGIWEQDLETGRGDWSEALRAIAGIGPDVEGSFRAVIALVHPDDRAAVEQAARDAVERGHDVNLEYRLVRPDGAVRWMSDKGRVLRDAEGHPARLIGISMDITERKQLEAQFQQSQKMEAVGQLAGGVAHDFNNLLTAILGYSVFLKEKLQPGTQEREDLDQIDKAANRACSLTRQLLAFSRKQILQPQVLDLNEVVQDLTNMLRRLIGENIEIAAHLEPLLAKVAADPGQIHQVLVNLAVNARDAMPDGGKLTIETGNVELTEQYAQRPYVPAGHYVMIAVTDTGVGMDARTRERIFDPVRRSGSVISAAPWVEGTRLGSYENRGVQRLGLTRREWSLLRRGALGGFAINLDGSGERKRLAPRVKAGPAKDDCGFFILRLATRRQKSPRTRLRDAR